MPEHAQEIVARQRGVKGKKAPSSGALSQGESAMGPHARTRPACGREGLGADMREECWSCGPLIDEAVSQAARACWISISE